MISIDGPEIVDVQSVAADFFNRHSVVLDDDDAPRYDRAVWVRACRDLGVSSILEPEEDGGLGAGAAMLSAVLVEAGRTLSPLPLLSSAVRAQCAIRLLATPRARDALLPGLLSGHTIATVAPWDESLRSVSATETGGEVTWTLSGSVHRVLDGLGADLLLVVASVGSDVGLFAVEGDLSREAQETIDITRRFAKLTLDSTPVRLLGTAGPSVLTTLDQWTTLALAADQVGGAQACLDMTVEYLKTRVQFGRVIGSFQSLKHQCADLALKVDDAHSALAHLVWALDESSDHLPEASAIAAVTASTAYVTCADETVHLHGGIGFTWEHDAHRHVRRALTDRSAFHSVRAAREAVLTARGL
ncbi:MAG: acyl-CoA dehydrogenase [Rhodococcus sp. (in: high G+C Gram-positive bacteria)]|uniref:acyl-CoA dehydrogenase family protein n=1 Tax=Rhodococcus sp. TaxID=1831 RepID=UPI0012239FAE|nr:acyl-CoA dehydrogenase family protein [Rhodococcus sp. (in: high G+C Gram-positive bacteria)]RZL23114.1 MAG: acyl-CoA dehydrogenase [Rhodococcus sp. (in: high G+C Gram-positive bacteria)]